MAESMDVRLAIYNYLATDHDLLVLIELDTGTSLEIESAISKTKQSGKLADKRIKLFVWEQDPRFLNARVDRHVLVIDILIPIDKQKSTGVAHDIADRLETLLYKKPIGTGLKKWKKNFDQQTTQGWYKASVLLTYNYIHK